MQPYSRQNLQSGYPVSEKYKQEIYHKYIRYHKELASLPLQLSNQATWDAMFHSYT